MKEQIITQRDERLSQVPVETPLTQEQRHQLEADVIRIVCAKDRTVKSSWVAGSGPVPKKKDRLSLLFAHEQSAGPSEKTIFGSSSPRESTRNFENLTEFLQSTFLNIRDRIRPLTYGATSSGARQPDMPDSSTQVLRED